jgi:hypothetical protein
MRLENRLISPWQRMTVGHTRGETSRKPGRADGARCASHGGLQGVECLLVFSSAVFNLTRLPKLLPRPASRPPFRRDGAEADPNVHLEVGVSQAETVTNAPPLTLPAEREPGWHILMYTASTEVLRCSDEPRCS